MPVTVAERWGAGGGGFDPGQRWYATMRFHSTLVRRIASHTNSRRLPSGGHMPRLLKSCCGSTSRILRTDVGLEMTVPGVNVLLQAVRLLSSEPDVATGCA